MYVHRDRSIAAGVRWQEEALKSSEAVDGLGRSLVEVGGAMISFATLSPVVKCYSLKALG